MGFLIVVEDRPWQQMPVQLHHRQSIDDHAHSQTDDRRQMKPPVRGTQTGDVTNQARVGASEVIPIEQIPGYSSPYLWMVVSRDTRGCTDFRLSAHISPATRPTEEACPHP